MPKITRTKKSDLPEVIVARTVSGRPKGEGHRWWLAKDKNELKEWLLGTVTHLKTTQQYRYRQAAINARLYGSMPLTNFVGSNLTKQIGANTGLPVDRPTMNVIQSCIDTLISRITQSRPRPVFLTDNGDYKARTLAKQMNSLINGELYQTKAYDLAPLQLRDGAVLGTGCLKVFETEDHRIGIDRVMQTELLVDPNDALYGFPRQLHQLKLVDKSVLAELFPKGKKEILDAEQAYPDGSSEASNTVADQVMLIESWHLPSGKKATDGRHVISCSSGILLDEPWKKERFPFIFLSYCPRLMGFWGQGLSEQLMGTQVEINRLLMTMSRAINLVGVPRVFVEVGSKVVKSHLNNEVGSIVEYQGTRPSYEVAPCIPQEVYAQLERLVQYAYQQSGVSALAATAQKPAGLNSGEAIRNYDDLQSDRFAALVRRYDTMFVDIAYQICDLAKDIAQEHGGYETIFPSKNSIKQVRLPDVKKLDDPFVIQCFDASALPRDPSGRLQKITEMMQGGLITPQEGRRMLDFPDIEQVEKLANAAEERLLQCLDLIVEDGDYTPPEPSMDIQLGQTLTTQYLNLYGSIKLEEKKMDMLRQFFAQLGILEQQALGASEPDPGAAPQAVPTAPPISETLPNIPQQ